MTVTIVCEGDLPGPIALMPDEREEWKCKLGKTGDWYTTDEFVIDPQTIKSIKYVDNRRKLTMTFDGTCTFLNRILHCYPAVPRRSRR